MARNNAMHVCFVIRQAVKLLGAHGITNTNVSLVELIRCAKIESGLNPDAQNGAAKGLFQLLNPERNAYYVDKRVEAVANDVSLNGTVSRQAARLLVAGIVHYFNLTGTTAIGRRWEHVFGDPAVARCVDAAVDGVWSGAMTKLLCGHAPTGYSPLPSHRLARVQQTLDQCVMSESYGKIIDLVGEQIRDGYNHPLLEESLKQAFKAYRLWYNMDLMMIQKNPLL